MNYSEKITIQEMIENLQGIVNDKKYLLSSMSIEDRNKTRQEIQLLEEEIEDCKIQFYFRYKNTLIPLTPEYIKSSLKLKRLVDDLEKYLQNEREY